jgi:hypothetical protein
MQLQQNNQNRQLNSAPYSYCILHTDSHLFHANIEIHAVECNYYKVEFLKDSSGCKWIDMNCTYENVRNISNQQQCICSIN